MNDENLTRLVELEKAVREEIRDTHLDLRLWAELMQAEIQTCMDDLHKVAVKLRGIQERLKI